MSLEKYAYELDIQDMGASDRLSAREALKLAHEFLTRITYLRHGDEPVMSTDREADETIKHYLGGREVFLGWILLAEEEADLYEEIIYLAEEAFYAHSCDDKYCGNSAKINECRDGLLAAAEDDECAFKRYRTPLGEVLEIDVDPAYLPAGTLSLSARLTFDENDGFMQVTLNDANGTELTASVGSECCGDIWEALLTKHFDNA